MPDFNYNATPVDGPAVNFSGTINAATREEAVQKINDEHPLFGPVKVTYLEEVDPSKHPPSRPEQQLKPLGGAIGADGGYLLPIGKSGDKKS